MKKLLLLTKMLLAVALLCVGQNAWGAAHLETYTGIVGKADRSHGFWTYASKPLTIAEGEKYVITLTNYNDPTADYSHANWYFEMNGEGQIRTIQLDGKSAWGGGDKFEATTWTKTWENFYTTVQEWSASNNGALMTLTVTRSSNVITVAYTINGSDSHTNEGSFSTTYTGESYEGINFYLIAAGGAYQIIKKVVYTNASSVETTYDFDEYVAAQKGDITPLINGEFDTAAGWTGGAHWNADWATHNWRGTTQNGYYEINSGNNGSMTYTLKNMPAGTYKVVAASHASVANNSITITPSVAGSNGTAMTAKNCVYVAGASEINTNGVQMPNSSSSNGFTSDAGGRNWQWITATGTLASEGDLVLSFTVAGNTNNAWVSMDDVHLYCTSLGGTSYTTTVTEGSAVSNSDGKVVTCDIVLTNPNSIITSDEAITTASGAALNNNLVGSTISNLVLYDGADNTFSMPAGDYTIGGATYYRSFTQDVYSTVCLPFTPNIAAGTYYEPTTLGDGYLTISEVADANLKPNTPYILKPSGNHTSLLNNNNAGNANKNKVVYSNNQPATKVSEKMWFTGRLEKIDVQGSWTGDYYVLGTDSELHKISDDGTVAVNPFRAYLYVSSGLGARSALRLNVGDNVTGVENVEAAPAEAEAKDGKFVEGNQLFIYKKGVKFNAAGQQVK